MKKFYFYELFSFACLILLVQAGYAQDPPPPACPDGVPCPCYAPEISAYYDDLSSKTICYGDLYNLTVSLSGGSEGQTWEFAWYTGSGTDSTFWNGSTWDNAANESNVWMSSYDTIWNVSPLSSTTFKVKVRHSAFSSCANEDLYGAEVTVNIQIDTTLTVSAPELICYNTEGDVSIEDSQTGVSYQLMNDTIPIGDPVSGDGYTIYLPTGNLLESATFHILAFVDGTDCSAQLGQTAEISVNPEIETGLSVSAPSAICYNTSTDIMIEESETEISYQLFDSYYNYYGSPVAGTGDTIYLPTGELTGTNTFSVLATIDGTECSAELGQTVEISVLQINTELTVSAAASVCYNSSADITLEYSDIGVIYQLLNDTVTVGDPVYGNGSTVYFSTGNLTETTTFSIAAEIDGVGCPVQLSQTVYISVYPEIATDLTLTAPSGICYGTSADIMIDSSISGTSYQLMDSYYNLYGEPVAGTSDTIYLPTGELTETTTFIILATIEGTECSAELSQTKTITVYPLPNVAVNASSTSVCLGAAVILAGNGAALYEWSGGITDGIGFIPQSTMTYTVTGTDEHNCTNTATETITVFPLPEITATAVPDTICAGGGATITATGATTYIWSHQLEQADTHTVYPPTNTIYIVTGTDENACIASTLVPVYVKRCLVCQ